MSEDERTSLCRRGLDDIFDPELRASIGRLIEDVRVNGDDAVCRALRDFDGIVVEPDELRVGAAEIAAASIPSAVDAAIDAAITNLRAFNTALLERDGFEREPVL